MYIQYYKTRKLFTDKFIDITGKGLIYKINSAPSSAI